MIRHHHHITHAAVTMALTLTALVASPALAMPVPASPGSCSEACSHDGYAPGPARPVAAPASSQPRSQITGTGPCSEVCSGRGYGSTERRPAVTPTSAGLASDASSAKRDQPARVPATVIRSIPGDTGFDWGDAGIGAGGTLGLILAATGGTLLLAHRRTQARTTS